jgi:hypothetical protein
MRKWVLIASLIFFAVQLTIGQDSQGRTTPVGAANFVENYIDIEAVGVPPKEQDKGSSAAYADARRAAQVLAARNLAEILSGLYLQSSTSFSDQGATDFVDSVRADLIRTSVPGGKAVEETSLEEFKKENLVRLVVRFPLDETLPYVMRRIGPRLQQSEKTLAQSPEPSKAEVKKASYDALIVKVPKEFKPSVGAKIFDSQNRLVYGATSVSPDVMMLQGTGKFAADTDKAKATFEAFGAHNVLVIDGTLYATKTDARISDTDASMVLAANESSHFLQRAQVFFVIGSKK